MKSFLSDLCGLFRLTRSPRLFTKYDQLTRPQLIKRIEQLEHELNQQIPAVKDKSRRPFDISQYGQRRIALKVAYLGWNYCGFAHLKEKNIPTVEGEIFKALQKCSLITSPEECNYSRGGRTDKGVSGLGQVIALDVRSTQRKLIKEHGDDRDLPYINMINSFLPEDIRILAWAPVATTFNARFDCLSRTYKYFFKKEGQDIERMREAASYMVGSHDFRNFCLLDAARNLQHYTREIISFEINPVEQDFYEVKLKGTGFLWHQVRYIMSVLFLVGQRLEPPAIIQDLLNIDKIPARPDYPLASGIPLMLYDCEYKNIKWIYEHSNNSQSSSVQPRLTAPVVTHSHFSQLWDSNAIKGLLYKECMKSVEQIPIISNNQTVSILDYMEQTNDGWSKILLGEGKYINTTKYRRLLERPLSETDAVKKEKYRLKQLKKSIEK
ncbi:hypothetical protein G6F37_008002 [Rhizopus arrhizus]|nr:hypothetical protein G6F38_011604 [Rhizopus arrhizus]KAG1156015.1 hypothetical protein G6F37_008002 [Rhizopus arrhizus]